MAYIGQEPVNTFSPVPSKDSFTGDGSTTTFDLQNKELFDYTKINTLINNLDPPITKTEISKTIGLFNKNNNQNIKLSSFNETEKETMIELTI